MQLHINAHGADMEISRNSSCGCGSGERYKKCCGVDDLELFPEPVQPPQWVPFARVVSENGEDSGIEILEMSYTDSTGTRELVT